MMGFSGIGIPGLIIILVITLIVFGPKKLPEIGSAFGKTLSEFKKSAKDIMDDHDNDTVSSTDNDKQNLLKD